MLKDLKDLENDFRTVEMECEIEKISRVNGSFLDSDCILYRSNAFGMNGTDTLCPYICNRAFRAMDFGDRMHLKESVRSVERFVT